MAGWDEAMGLLRDPASGSSVVLCPRVVALVDASAAATSWTALQAHLADPRVRVSRKEAMRVIFACVCPLNGVCQQPYAETPVSVYLSCSGLPKVPLTLCHGDFHVANALLVDGPISPDAVVLLDWWVLSHTSPTASPPPLRRRWFVAHL
jgi:hypothetical protein